METIYNSPSASNYFVIILAIIVSLVFMAIGVFLIIVLIKGKAKFFRNIILYIIGFAFAIIGVYVFGVVAENIYYETRYVLIPYMQGDYEEIAGVVENCVISDDEREINFEVNNIKFFCSNFEVSTVGYQGHSLENGDYVKIRFMSFNGENSNFNYIMKLEKQVEKNNGITGNAANETVSGAQGTVPCVDKIKTEG